MESFDSSFSSLASASSSTLIVTPHPNSKGDDPIFPPPSSRKRPPGVPMTRMMPTRMSGKGFIEPHHSHLPRRTRRLVESESRPRSSSFDTNKTEAGFESKDSARSPSRDPVDRRPIAVPAPSSSPVSKEVKPGVGPLQPHITNLPRRHGRRPHTVAQRRQERLCLQEIGHGSGVYVGLSGRRWRGEPSSSSSDEDSEDEEEEDDLKHRYSAIVRLIPCPSKDEEAFDEKHTGDSTGVLRLWLPNWEPTEPGCTQLSIRQLRHGCSFLHRLRSSSQTNKSALVLAPPSCILDAFSLAVCYKVAMSSPSSRRRAPSPCAAPLVPRSEEQSHSELPKEDEYTKVHELIMSMHDEDLAVVDDENGKRSGRGDLRPGPSGLRNEWRGLLRYEGVVMLDGIWTPPTPTTSS